MSCIKSNIIYVSPSIAGGKLLDNGQIEFRVNIRTPTSYIGKNVFINHPNYDKGLYKVVGVWVKPDGGGTIKVQHSFNDIGHKNSAGLPTDITGGGYIMICDSNVESDNILKSFLTNLDLKKKLLDLKKKSNNINNLETNSINNQNNQNSQRNEPTPPKSKVGLYVGIGVGALVLIFGSFLAYKHFSKIKSKLINK